MKMYQLTINDNAPVGQSVLALLKSIGDNIVTLVPLTKTTRKIGMEKVKEGRVYSAKNVSNLTKKTSFSAISIDTKSYKFDREEANAR